MASDVAATTTNRDSLRASVFNVCLELGALEENSLLAEWMFNDPSSDGANVDDDRRTMRQESISMGWEDTGMVHDERHHIPFSIRASAFAARLRQKGKHRQKPDDSNAEGHTGHEFGSRHISLNRGSFFQRTTRKSETAAHHEKLAVPSITNTGHVSTNTKSFFRLKARSATAPLNTKPDLPGLNPSTSAPNSDLGLQASSPTTLPPIVTALGEDDDWEEIEARPQSPLYALKNKGINPAPAILTKKKRSGIRAKHNDDLDHTTSRHGFPFSLPRSIFLSTPSQRKKTTSRPATLFPVSRSRPSRQNLIIPTKSLQPRGFSTSLPSSPFLLVTSHDSSGDPAALSTSVVLSPLNAPSPPPVFPVSVSKAHRTSMGYHNQFFPNTPSKRAHPKSASYPSLPDAIPFQRGRQIPFPRMP